MDIHNKDVIASITLAAHRRARFYRDIEDDFAQYCLLRYLEGSKATVEQLLVDFLRKNYGRPKGRRNMTIKNTMSLSNSEEVLQQVSVNEHNSDFSKIMDKLEGVERTIAVLHFKWDFTLKEIGEVLDVSESRVSQLLSALNSKFRKRYGNA